MHALAVSEKITTEERITELLSFDESTIRQSLEKAKSDISAAKNAVRSQPLLATLEPTLMQLEQNILSLSRLSATYDDVYKSLIIPVRKEGQGGIRYTRNWSIVSIILSAVVSIIVTIYFQVHPIAATGSQAQRDSITSSSVDDARGANENTALSPARQPNSTAPVNQK